MNNHTFISLLFAICTLITSQVFAESPAEIDNIENIDIEPVFIDTEDETSPVDEDNSATNEAPDALEETTEEVVTETVETGTVLNTADNADKPMLVHQLDFPVRGMSEDKVQNELGRPGSIISAIGEPPITQWVYDDRIVYFEYSTVLHVVAK